MAKQQIVAIVGRPNVGKSSFFNRMVGKRDAIVDDVAGVTRDRHYGEVNWAGKNFTLIDTGGYLPESNELFDVAIKEQVEIAIEQADTLLLIVDVQTGITQTDSEIASMIQQFGKQVHLIVNKVDDERYTNDIYEFYNLGLGDPLPVSAISGRGSGDLLDVITEAMKPIEFKESDDIKIAVIGKENVGKSSYVNSLLNENRNIVTNVAGTTRDSNDTLFQYHGKKITIIDTAGLKRKTKVKENVLFYSQLRTINALERADVITYFIDTTEGITNQDQRLISDITSKQKPFILVFNKWDLFEDKTDKLVREFIKDERMKIPQHKYIPIVTISATDRQRIHKVLDKTIEVYENSHRRITTSKLNDFFIPLVKMNKPPAPQGKEVKINYVTQMESHPPKFIFFSNRPKLIAAHYKRFLENKFREHFDFEGVPVKFFYRAKSEDRERSQQV
jgi:GTP-binding protein